MTDWPDKMFELIRFSGLNARLTDLQEIVETEDWGYQNTSTTHHLPILYNYLNYTYSRLAEEDKLSVSGDGQHLTFNTGLVTSNQEPVFAFCTTNRNAEYPQQWLFKGWRRKGEYDMTHFDELPGMAHYFADHALLVLDHRLEVRSNIEHIVSENKSRFPAPFDTMSDYSLQTIVKGAIDNAIERVRRNYKTAIPQYHRGGIQLLLPLCLQDPTTADIALVIQKHSSFYRASTCLTLDMAYSNARLLARPDKDWLLP